MTTEHPYNSGRWTKARFQAFIKSILRAATRKWGPINEARKNAWLERGVYKCAGYKKRWHKVPASIVVKGKRINNVFVDHISPIIDRNVGFVSWDDVINRMFCEIDNLQVLCRDCHDRKTADERKNKNE